VKTVSGKVVRHWSLA